MPLDHRDALLEGARALGLEPSTHQCDAMLGYLALLQKWNEIHNLTAVRRPAEMLTHHLLDSLAALAPLRRHLKGRVAPRLLDVGSGGGLPGVVLAIMEPDMLVTCVDSVRKKAIFIRQAGAELRLGNLRAEHSRVEALRLQSFNVVTSRAFASLEDFSRLTHHLLANDGVWMAMKGKTPDDEIRALPADVTVFHVEQLNVPQLDAERCLVWMRKEHSEARSG